MVGGQTGILGEWGVERAGNHYDGPIPAGLALIEGKNAATVRVGNEVGLDNVLALAKRAGINSPLREFPGDVPRQQRDHAFRTRAGLHGFPQRRLAARRAVSADQDRGRRRRGALPGESPPARADRGRGARPIQVHNALSQDLKMGVASGGDLTAQAQARWPPVESRARPTISPTRCLPGTTAT